MITQPIAVTFATCNMCILLATVMISVLTNTYILGGYVGIIIHRLWYYGLGDVMALTFKSHKYESLTILPIA